MEDAKRALLQANGLKHMVAELTRQNDELRRQAAAAGGGPLLPVRVARVRLAARRRWHVAGPRPAFGALERPVEGPAGRRRQGMCCVPVCQPCALVVD